MFEQTNQGNQVIEAKPFSFRQKWNDLHPHLKKGIIAACILLIISIITSTILIAVVLSWKPVVKVTYQSDFPVSDSNSVVNVKTATVKEKKLLSDDANIDVTVTTIKSKSRLLQDDSKSPSILTFYNGEGVVTQLFTPDDFTLFIDPDLVLASYESGRNLQASSVAPQNNILEFDDKIGILQAVEESILKQAAELLNATPEELTIEYQETIRIDLKSDGLYHFEQNDNTARSLRRGGWRPPTTISWTAGGTVGLRSYLPEIERMTEAEFSADNQIQVSINTATARLLQIKEPTLSQETNIECRSRPVNYKKYSPTRKVKIVDEETFNCSYHCTGNTTSRVCPVELVKQNKCGYKTSNATGKEKVKGRLIITRRKQCAQMKKKCKEEKKKAAKAKQTSQPVVPFVVTDKPAPAITPNAAAASTPTQNPTSQTPSVPNQNT